MRKLTAQKRLMVFSGSANIELGKEIAKLLGEALGKVKISRFSNGEIYIRYLESVRGADTFVIQTLGKDVNDNLMELLIMIDALKRASAKRVTAVIPHYGYSRQDKKSAAREPITAKLVADLLTVAGVDRVVAMDLHAGQIQGYFNIPFDHMSALPLFINYFEKKNLKKMVIISPDVGRVKTINAIADKLDVPLAILYKRRPAHNVAEVINIVGEVKGMSAIIVDDMIDTGGTLCQGADALKENGAERIYACATHPILSGDAVAKIEKSPIEELIVTNTIPLDKSKKSKKIKILSIAPLLANTIINIFEDKSVSQLFEENI